MTRREAALDLIMLFTGRDYPLHADFTSVHDMNDDAAFELQTFLANHSKCTWLTGIALMEAVDTLTDEAIDNSEYRFHKARPDLT